MPYFVFLTFKPSTLVGLLDAIIFLSDPHQKNGVHVTIQGPLENPPEMDQLQRKFDKSKVHILGAGKFFNERQNTVYLKCDSDQIKQNWLKKTYKNYSPHITIYDGPSKEIANELYSLLKDKRLFFSLECEKVIVLPHSPGQTTFNLMFELDLTELTRLLGKKANPLEIQNMSWGQRRGYLERLLPNLTWESKNAEKD